MISTNFVFESFFELLFGLFELFIILKEIEMGQSSQDNWESMRFQKREELKCFHFKT